MFAGIAVLGRATQPVWRREWLGSLTVLFAVLTILHQIFQGKDVSGKVNRWRIHLDSSWLQNSLQIGIRVLMKAFWGHATE